MRPLELVSSSPAQTHLLGSHIGSLAERGDTVLLTGELGTGKTCLIQGIAEGLGVKERAFSPSFVIVREYHGRMPLYHIDLYRLDTLDELADLGLDEYIGAGGVTAVEWAERGSGILPQDALHVHLGYVRQVAGQRQIRVEGIGSRHAFLAGQLREATARDPAWS